MNAADWRALLEAYLDGRLSAEAFTRRFVEGWRQGGAVPGPIRDLQRHVEAFESDLQDVREEGQLNDDELRQAAQRALSNLNEDTPVSASTFDRTRTREDMRRFQIQVNGCAGVGCIIALIWVALCVVQITFVSEWVQNAFGWSAWPSSVVGFVLAFVPIIGNLLAFLQATKAHNWAPWLAAIVFFAAPAATIISGWMRWRRYGR